MRRRACPQPEDPHCNLSEVLADRYTKGGKSLPNPVTDLPEPPKPPAPQPPGNQPQPQPNNPQPKNPLHGVTLAAMLEFLIENLGWEEMARAVDIRCFTHEPSLTSSLKFLRKVPWARGKVEQLYLRALRRKRT